MAISLLVLTDFGQPANRALDYATGLAGAIGAELVLLHVERDSYQDPELLTGKLWDRGQAAINRALHALTSNRPVPATAEVRHGRVGAAVAEAVQRHHPAAVVMGLSDAGSTPEELISTTALDLLRANPHPMLVVPHDAPAPAVPRRILLAVDGENFTLGPHTAAVQDLLRALQPQITVLHSYPPGTTADAVAAFYSVARTGLTISLPPVQTCNVMHEHPFEGILETAATGNYDLIALVARPRSFWGELFERSVTAQVLLNSTLPVLVLPAQ